MTAAADTTVSTATTAVLVATLFLAATSSTTWRVGARSPSRILVSDAAFPAAMAPLPSGGLLYAERLTGRVVRVEADGTATPIGGVDVATEGEHRGSLGLAVRDDEVFVSFTGIDGRLRVARLGGGDVWVGPMSADRSNGGRIAFDPSGRLVIGVGDLLDPAAVADPTTPNGKLLALDPDGPAEQRPEVISSGWNNPFAFSFAPDGTLYVADNVGGDGDERLAVGNAGPRPVVLTALPPHSAPSGLALTPDGRLAICSYTTRSLRTYRLAGGAAIPEVVPLATDCSIGVVTLADGSLAYADEITIRTVVP